jgi:hypothetical protein
MMRAFIRFGMVMIALTFSGYADDDLTTPEGFTVAFRRAHDTRDVQQMERLFDWDGVTSKMRRSRRESIQREFAYQISSIEWAPVEGRGFEIPPEPRFNKPFSINGKLFQFNLKATMTLSVCYEPPNTNGMCEVSPIGRKDGRFYLAVPIPSTR